MRQWDIFLFPFPEEQPHPVVIVWSDDRCSNSELKYVNGLICTTVRLGRPTQLNEVLRDEAVGLDGTTAVRCDFLQALPKASFLGQKSHVPPLQRLQIMRHVARCLRFQD